MNNTFLQNGTKKSHIKKQHALALWSETGGNITKLTKQIGIDRKTFYNWLKDPQFAYAIKEVELLIGDEIKYKLIEKALAGDMRAITFYLEHRHSDFKENASLAALTSYREKAQQDLLKYSSA